MYIPIGGCRGALCWPGPAGALSKALADGRHIDNQSSGGGFRRVSHHRSWNSAMSHYRPFTSDDPQRWRRRAAELRQIADGMAGLPRARESVMRTAEEYERRAEACGYR